MSDHKAWLKKASSDLKASKILLDDPDTLENASYHSQQCAEKALKAFFVFRAQPIIKTHDLEYLLKICCVLDPNFIILKKEAYLLNPYSTQFRYPDDRFFIDYQEALKAIQQAETILNFVQAAIEK